jgi:hypothetical protein
MSIYTFSNGEALSSVRAKINAGFADIDGRTAGIVNVKSFGAVGDGVADDTAAIQAALNASRDVFIPSGVFRCNARIFVTSPVSISGPGQIVFSDGITYGAVDTSGNGGFDFLDVTGINISGVRFKSEESTQISAIMHFRGCSDVTVSGCEFRTPDSPNGSKCIIVQRSPNTALVRNVSITSNAFIQSSNAVLVIGQTDNRPTNVIIDGNIVDSKQTDNDALIKVDKWTNNCVISNNSINGRNFAKSGISVEQGSNRLVVTGNTVKNTDTYGIVLSTDSPDFAVAFNDVLISNNVISDVTIGSGFGIYLDSTGAASDNVVIKGNLISNTKIGIRENINIITDMIVDGNAVFDSTTEGMQIRSSGAIVCNNVVKGAAAVTSLSGLGTSDNQIVTGNVFQQNDGTAAIAAFAGARGVGNTFNGNIGLKANSERVVGTVTLSADIEVSELYPTAGAITATLGSGSRIGQIKTIRGSEIGFWNTSTVSVTNHETSSPEVITFSARTDTAVLMWDGVKWITIKLSGATV